MPRKESEGKKADVADPFLCVENRQGENRSKCYAALPIYSSRLSPRKGQSDFWQSSMACRSLSSRSNYPVAGNLRQDRESLRSAAAPIIAATPAEQNQQHNDQDD